MMKEEFGTITFQRNLPHIFPDGGTFFMTARLFGSLPLPVVEALKLEFGQAQKRIFASIHDPELAAAAIHIEHKRLLWKFDRFLDKGETGPIWLADPRCAEIVLDKIRSFDGVRFTLHAACIMPNHFHAVFTHFTKESLPPVIHKGNSARSPVSETMRLLKGNTGYFCNRVLGRSGTFWQDESFDHWCRDNKEFLNTTAYSIKNPEAAKLVDDWQKWPFTYLAPGILTEAS